MGYPISGMPPARASALHPAGLRRLAAARADLTLAFVRRELAVRYKEAYVGVAWAVLQPLAFMGIFTLLFAYMAKIPGSGAVTAYVALVPWLFAATAMSQGSLSILNQLGVVSKIYFPRSVLPLAAVVAAAVDAVIAFGLQLVLLSASGVGLAPTLLLWPLLMLLTAALVFGVALILSVAVVRFRDLRYVIPLCIQLLMLASPVGYPLDVVPDSFRSWYLANPFAGLMDGFRRIALHGEAPPMSHLLPAAVWASVLLLCGAVYFRREEATIADHA